AGRATAGMRRSSCSPRMAVSRSAMTAPSRMTATDPVYVEASMASMITSTCQQHASIRIGRHVLEIDRNVTGGNEVPRTFRPLDDHERMRHRDLVPANVHELGWLLD